MKINYRVLHVDENQHSMVVRYWTDTVSEDMLATEFESNGKIKRSKNGPPLRCSTDYSLTFYDNPQPTEEEVDFFIKRNAPVNWLKIKEEVLNPNIKTDLSAAKKILLQDLNFEVNI